MSPRLPPIEQLPHQSAIDDTSRSSELAREIRSDGGVAITHQGEVEMVMIAAQTYRDLVEIAERKAVLAELFAEFDRQPLREPGVHEKIDSVMACRGISSTARTPAPRFESCSGLRSSAGSAITAAMTSSIITAQFWWPA